MFKRVSYSPVQTLVKRPAGQVAGGFESTIGEGLANPASRSLRGDLPANFGANFWVTGGSMGGGEANR